MAAGSRHLPSSFGGVSLGPIQTLNGVLLSAVDTKNCDESGIVMYP
jgi:hypothetical protein